MTSVSFEPSIGKGRTVYLHQRRPPLFLPDFRFHKLAQMPPKKEEA